jgi:hypothetical protein
MHSAHTIDLVSRAQALLWVIARCDVENLNSQRAMALDKLCELESRATELQIQHLYHDVVDTVRVTG